MSDIYLLSGRQMEKGKFSLRVWREVQLQAKELNPLRVLFICGGSNREGDSKMYIGLEQELHFFSSIYLPTLTFGHMRFGTCGKQEGACSEVLLPCIERNQLQWL